MERLAPFCEFLGLSEAQVESMKVYAELFVENGGREMMIRAKDYEAELAAIELEN